MQYATIARQLRGEMHDIDQGKGLVVLSGCAHAGIVDTVKQAQKVSGIEKVHAVMGGVI